MVSKEKKAIYNIFEVFKKFSISYSTNNLKFRYPLNMCSCFWQVQIQPELVEYCSLFWCTYELCVHNTKLQVYFVPWHFYVVRILFPMSLSSINICTFIGITKASYFIFNAYLLTEFIIAFTMLPYILFSVERTPKSLFHEIEGGKKEASNNSIINCIR